MMFSHILRVQILGIFHRILLRLYNFENKGSFTYEIIHFN